MLVAFHRLSYLPWEREPRAPPLQWQHGPRIHTTDQRFQNELPGASHLVPSGRRHQPPLTGGQYRAPATQASLGGAEAAGGVCGGDTLGRTVGSEAGRAHLTGLGLELGTRSRQAPRDGRGGWAPEEAEGVSSAVETGEADGGLAGN